MLLIDGGQSHCRAVEVRDGVAGEVVRLPGLPRVGRRYDELRALVAAREVELVAAGLTGYRGEPIDWPAPRVIVTNDAVTAYLGALGETPGAVIAAGTGAIALASDGARWARADGHGTLLGDHGGGYWIGRRAVSLALRGDAPDLLQRARTRFGDELVRAIYDSADPTATIAGFAPEVAAAAREGDPIAARIWQDAGAELARPATDALRALAAAAPGSAPLAGSPPPSPADSPPPGSPPPAGSSLPGS